jgi:hypothetical protein
LFHLHSRIVVCVRGIILFSSSQSTTNIMQEFI